jgi:hypothetical protein
MARRFVGPDMKSSVWESTTVGMGVGGESERLKMGHQSPEWRRLDEERRAKGIRLQLDKVDKSGDVFWRNGNILDGSSNPPTWATS